MSALSLSSTSTRVDSMELVFSADNPCNTEITLGESGVALYRVSTTVSGSPKSTVTRVYAQNHGGSAVIASWKWRDIRPDVLTLGRDGPAISSSKWLKKSILPFSNSASFASPTGRKFTWKGNLPGQPYKLYIPGDRNIRPAATFHKSHPVLPSSPSDPSSPTRRYSRRKTKAPLAPARLILDERVQDPRERDYVLISFLMLEKTRRLIENSSLNKADILGTYSDRRRREGDIECRTP